VSLCLFNTLVLGIDYYINIYYYCGPPSSLRIRIGHLPLLPPPLILMPRGYKYDNEYDIVLVRYGSILKRTRLEEEE
jgi:hypothetical protein